MDTSPESPSSEATRPEQNSGLSFQPVWSIVLQFTLSLIVLGVGVQALSDPPGRQNDLFVVAAFLTAGLALGVAATQLRQRSMIIRHMRDVHPGAPLPEEKL